MEEMSLFDRIKVGYRVRKHIHDMKRLRDEVYDNAHGHLTKDVCETLLELDNDIQDYYRAWKFLVKGVY